MTVQPVNHSLAAYAALAVPYGSMYMSNNSPTAYEIGGIIKEMVETGSFSMYNKKDL